MDIDYALKTALEIARKMQDGHGIDHDDADELATLMIEIDNWIRKGGSLPAAWQHLTS
jgi:CheY-specific phosphatase CheX